MGDVMVKFSDGSQILVQNVHHVPELTRSLMSVGKLDDFGYKVIFASKSFRITRNMIIAKGNKVGSLYPLVVHQKSSYELAQAHGVHFVQEYDNHQKIVP